MPKTKSYNTFAVLETAAQIFQKKGYNRTSVDDILKATGLSRSSLYDSFKDKHNLYLQTLEYYKSLNIQKLVTINQKDVNGLRKLEVLFENVVNHLVENPNDNGCLLINAAAEMSKQCYKTSQVVCNNRDEVQELLSSWISDAEQKKMIKLNKPVQAYSQFLYSTLCGLRVMNQSGAGKADLDNVVKVALGSLN
ncbi:MAG: TetR/AcrR family transcriptional regulator [Bacteroidetes bacterium]|nr:TetR/AcrR family transcriptional regulator [Bacteroidota bacterium]